MVERNRAAILRQIRSLSRSTDEHFKNTYLETIQNFAAFVQELPGSENHHHAYRGGLLDHALDVARRAMALQKGYLLPPGAPPEVGRRAEDRWIYAVMAAALFHDVGKPVTDQIVRVCVSEKAKLTRWNPWLGPMTPGLFYLMSYREGREYADHDLVAPFIARRLMPQAVICWLGEDVQVMTTLLACLGRNGQRGDPLNEIIEEADASSAASAIGVKKPAMPGIRKLSPDRYFKMAILKLIEKKTINLNKPGACGFYDGADLWLVSKRALNDIRKELLGQGIQVPTNNVALMEDMGAAGVIALNDGKAIWRCIISIPDNDFHQNMTFLRVRSTTLWPDNEKAPSLVEGSIDVAEGSQEDEAPNGGASGNNFIAKELGNKKAYPRRRQIDISEVEEPAEIIKPGSAAKIADSEIEFPGKDSEFLQWLRCGISEGRISVNTPKSSVHITSEGLLMVSPRIFKEYDEKTFRAAQRSFLSLKLNVEKKGGGNLLEYAVLKNGKENRGGKMPATLKGIVVPAPGELLGMQLPKSNASLKLMSTL